ASRRLATPGELPLRCLRRRKLLETNTDSPPWARPCNWGRLSPAELADGLALEMSASRGSPRDSPQRIGSSAPRCGWPGIRRAGTYHKERIGICARGGVT